MAMKRADDPRLDIARRLLFTPDLLTYFLTGHEINEYTIASTSEMLDARTRSWNEPLLRRMGMRPEMMCPITMPGTVVGNITPRVAEATGLDSKVKVVAVGSHDTASAAFASPRNYATDRAAFLSSGTWSLLGVELDEPVLTEEARRAGFSNEGGVGAKTLLLQNITGLWILQRLAAQWRERGEDPRMVKRTDRRSRGRCRHRRDRCRRPALLTPRRHGTDHSRLLPRNLPTVSVHTRRICQMRVPISRRTLPQGRRAGQHSPAPPARSAADHRRRIQQPPAQRHDSRGHRPESLCRIKAEATAIGNILLQAITARQISSKEQVTDIRQL